MPAPDGSTTKPKRVRYKPQPNARGVYYSLLKDGSKMFYVRHPMNAAGQRPYEKVGTRLDQAKARAHEIAAPDAVRVVSVGTTLADVIAEWKQHRVMRPRSVETFDRILTLHIEPKLGRAKVRDITPLAVERFLNGLRRVDGKPGPLAEGTRRLILATLDMVLQHAVKMGALGSVPRVDRNRKPKRGESRRRILTMDEERNLLAYCGAFPWMRPIITVALHQALRLGEVGALQWEDVDFGNNRLTVQYSLGRDGTLGPTKGGRVETIRLTPQAREALLELNPDLSATGFVFKNRLGGHLAPRDASLERTRQTGSVGVLRIPSGDREEIRAIAGVVRLNLRLGGQRAEEVRVMARVAIGAYRQIITDFRFGARAALGAACLRVRSGRCSRRRRLSWLRRLSGLLRLRGDRSSRLRGRWCDPGVRWLADVGERKDDRECQSERRVADDDCTCDQAELRVPLPGTPPQPHGV